METESAAERIYRWRINPVDFVRENFGVEPDAWQKEVLMAFVDNQRIAMKACKGPGKTCVLSWMAWNFLVTRPHPKVIATSISGDNLSDGLWTEMATWMAKSPYISASFEWGKTRIVCKAHPQTWYMSARNWSKSASKDQQANTLAGIHAEYVLFILDESGGIPEAVMATAEAALSTGTELKLIQAGNPTHLEGPLYRACTNERHLWYVVEITSDPDNPKRTPRVKIEWAKQQIDKYGRDNPWVLVNVFGQFPPASINALFGPDEVRAAMNRALTPDKYSFAQKRLGVDVARFGDDDSVIAPRQGLMVFKLKEFKNLNSQELGDQVMFAKQKWGSHIELVDGTGGWGSGVVDYLKASGHDCHEIQFSGKAMNPRYVNKRAEMYFNLKDWIRRGGCLPKDEALLRELCALKYFFKGKDQIQLIPKEQVKEELEGQSPDRADAVALTFSIPESALDNSLENQARTMGFNIKTQEVAYNPVFNDLENLNETRAEYDPFRNYD